MLEGASAELKLGFYVALPAASGMWTYAEDDLDSEMNAYWGNQPPFSGERKERTKHCAGYIVSCGRNELAIQTLTEALSDRGTGSPEVRFRSPFSRGIED